MSGNTSDRLEQAVQSNPALEKLLSQLSGQDMAKLRAALADPETTRKIMATPAAQRILKQLSGEEEK